MLLSWFTLASLFLLAALPSEASNSKPGCQKECENLTAPCQFDIGKGGSCSMEDEYWSDTINCSSFYIPLKSFSGKSNIIEVGQLSPSQEKQTPSILHPTTYQSLSGPAKLTLGLGFCFSCLSFVISGIYFSVKKHKFIKLKSKFFQRNGGLLLEQQIALHGGTTIFTAEELDMTAADCYKKTHIFGSGDSGTGKSHKGLSPQKVAEGQIECFISEIVTLTKVNHQNLVKFLGCCLETEAPVLVYELACNGTLFDFVHHTKEKSSLPWDILLKIATESAAALAYLHSTVDSSKPMIIHGNVKSSNILLTDCFMAKISGFGPSRLVPSTESQISTLVQETLGYLDPEYLHTGQLTDKSDVYSFGVVLLELLTGEMPISFDRPENQRVITSYFLLSAEQCGLFQIVAPQLVNEGSREQVRAFADLAKSCLKLSRAERPTMEQVARELHRLSNTYPRVKVDSHDTESERFSRAVPSVDPNRA